MESCGRLAASVMTGLVHQVWAKTHEQQVGRRLVETQVVETIDGNIGTRKGVP